MNSVTNKKDIFYIIVLILTFITVIVGATFALYAFIFSQDEGTSAVYTGTFSIEYLSGEIINFNLLYPIEKPTIDEEKNVYKNNFRVTNTGSLDGLITVDIELNENEFSNGTLQYSLYSNGVEEVATGNVEGRNIVNIAKNLELKNNENVDYTLLIWIADNGLNQNEEMKKSLTGTIKVTMDQKIY